MSREDKRSTISANRLYRYSAMNEESTDKRNKSAYIKMNDQLQAKQEQVKDVQGKPEPAADLQTKKETTVEKRINWQKKLQEAVIWKEILSEPLSKRRRRR